MHLMKLVNYHTHTNFCDGVSTAEQVVLAAIDKGMSELGFSGHSYVKEQGFGMDAEALAEYKAEIKSLKEKYKDRIKIYLGIEYDYFSELDTADFDFVIGSVHVLIKNGKCLEIDISRDAFIKDTNEYFGGDFIAYAEEYYKLVGDLYRKIGCDIIGHLDLITKFNEGDALFNTDNERYRAAQRAAIAALSLSPAVFEVNTGAIARGYRSTPYPDALALDMIIKMGGELVVGSDCHKAEQIDFGLTDTLKALESMHCKIHTSLGSILNKTRN